MRNNIPKKRNFIQEKAIYTRLLLIGLLVLLTSILIRTAWVCDDAFITFRTLDNWIHGYGLTWNAGYRVQAYTHPLWLFLLAPFYSLTQEPYYTSLFLSLLLSVAGVCLLLWHVTSDGFPSVLLLLTLSLSKCFTDYATSGLETPLGYFLSALFLLVYRFPQPSFKSITWLSLISAGLILTRPDFGLIFLPALIYMTFRYKKWIGLFGLMPGFLILLTWEGFSILYYGSWVANTAIAKLYTGIPTIEKWSQGLSYLYSCLIQDPLSVVVIVGGLAYIFFQTRRRWKVLGGCVLLYLIWVVSIGGDFMGGRFLAIPFWMIVGSALAIPLPRSVAGRTVAVAALLGLGLLNPLSPLFSGKTYRKDEPITELIDDNGVCDERGFYYRNTGLLLNLKWGQTLRHPDISRGDLARRLKQKVNVNGAIGMLGYYAGPKVFVVDYYALGDAFLARQPMVEVDSDYVQMQIAKGITPPYNSWRPGHFRRALPKDYLASITSGKNLFTDPKLKKQWDLLSAINTLPFWSGERWNAILALANDNLFQQDSTSRTPWSVINYSEILAYDSTCVQSLFQRSFQRFQAGDYMQAEKDLENAEKYSPLYLSSELIQFKMAWEQLARKYLENKQFIRSLHAAEKLIELGGIVPPEVLEELKQNAEVEKLSQPDNFDRNN
ncbi:MAG: hypothetical protein EBS07_01280 [Sphingobacteriia bacterium]|nr:hypothetical protein [Sphingobacteriia bacterium]